MEYLYILKKIPKIPYTLYLKKLMNEFKNYNIKIKSFILLLFFVILFYILKSIIAFIWLGFYIIIFYILFEFYLR